jgi:hypothetical protein
LPVVQIAVAQDHLIDLVLGDEVGHVVFLEDRQAVGIMGPGQFSRVAPPVDLGDLRGGEADDFVVLIVLEEQIEIVEVAPGSAEDQHPFASHHVASLR